MKGFRTWSVKLTTGNGENSVSHTFFARRRDAKAYAEFQKQQNPDKEIWLYTHEPLSPNYQKLVVVKRNHVWQPPF